MPVIVMVIMVVIMTMRVRVVMMGVAVGMIVIVVLGVMMDALRLGGGRVFAEYQRFDGDRHGVGRHADAAEIDVVEIAQHHAVDGQDLLSTRSSSRRMAPSVWAISPSSIM